MVANVLLHKWTACTNAHAMVKLSWIIYRQWEARSVWLIKLFTVSKYASQSQILQAEQLQRTANSDSTQTSESEVFDWIVVVIW